jgi:hypothetical protein
MSKKVVHNYPKNFEIFVLEKLVEFDKEFRDICGTLSEHGNTLAEHSSRLHRIEEKLEIIDERTAFLPKLYDAVDAFMKEIKESREERVMLNARMNKFEGRLAVVEATLSISPVQREF